MSMFSLTVMMFKDIVESAREDMEECIELCRWRKLGSDVMPYLLVILRRFSRLDRTVEAVVAVVPDIDEK